MLSQLSHKICLFPAKANESNLRLKRETTAFTNGCFDILHTGHLQLLLHARHEADVLVVGINSDFSVRRLKGPSRPIFPQGERALMLAALSCVDRVVIFGDDTPEELIHELRPDVLVKGADWEGHEISGLDFVRSYGGRIVFVPLVSGRSTTAIVNAGKEDWVMNGRF